MEYVCELTDDYPGIGFGDDEYSGTVERRERVVRCRDCGYSITYSSGQMCCLRTSRFVDQHDFCSKGAEKWTSCGSIGAGASGRTAHARWGNADD